MEELQTPVETTDERGGLPSASGLSRISLCHGSFQMEQEAPSQPSSPIAERGTRIHAAMEGDVAELSDEEMAVVDELRGFDAILLHDCKDFLIREVRMWYELDGERLFSGKLDVGGIDRVNNESVVINYKTGRGQPSVENNWQAMAESVLFHDHYNPGQPVRYCFVQPESPFGKMVCHVFTASQLEAARQKVLKVVALSRGKDAQLFPSEEACKWCDAVSFCEAASWRVDNGLRDDGLPLSEMDSPSRAAVLNKLREARDRATSMYDYRVGEARELIAEDVDAITGWRLKSGRVMEKVTSTPLAFAAAKSAGVSTEEFLRSCTVSAGKFKKLMGDRGSVEQMLSASEYSGVVKISYAKMSLQKL